MTTEAVLRQAAAFFAGYSHLTSYLLHLLPLPPPPLVSLLRTPFPLLCLCCTMRYATKRSYLLLSHATSLLRDSLIHKQTLPPSLRPPSFVSNSALAFARACDAIVLIRACCYCYCHPFSFLCHVAMHVLNVAAPSSLRIGNKVTRFAEVVGWFANGW
jgi:hypothetical protein